MNLDHIKTLLKNHPWEYQSFHTITLRDKAEKERLEIIAEMDKVPLNKFDELFEYVPTAYQTEFWNEFTHRRIS